MAEKIRTREPVELAAGDSIHFIRTLADYVATDGWSLKYELVGTGEHAGLKYEFVSQANGQSHEVNVADNITLPWLPGEYELVGFAENAANAERHQFYQAPCLVNPNQEAGPVDVTTHAQRMLSNVEAQLEQLSQQYIEESDIEGTRLLRRKMAELTNLRDYYLGVRKDEVNAERARAGLPSRKRIRSSLNVTLPGPLAGQTGYFPFGNTGFGGTAA